MDLNNDNFGPFDRELYESALRRLYDLGTKAMLVPRLIGKKDAVKESLLKYYEHTEEYEKCKFVRDYFNTLEKEISISSIVDSIKNNKK